jgi:hypothetical protein
MSDRELSEHLSPRGFSSRAARSPSTAASSVLLRQAAKAPFAKYRWI